ncbi:MAG: DUF4416 family protein [Deltaproteobacteria bacterium]|nr:DUF4416 family protein [Deltaproteobacteria bacterium]
MKRKAIQSGFQKKTGRRLKDLKNFKKMSKPKKPAQVKLIASIIAGDKNIIKPVLSNLQERFGNIDFISEKMEFNHTKYYNDEIGENLFRKMVSFNNLIYPSDLAAIKIFTNSIEYQYADNGKRKVNIDPGYIAMEKFVLASCKNFSHRIYLSEGVYADLTLIYKSNNFQ